MEGSDLSGLKQTVTLTADKNSAGLPDGSLTVVQDNAVADDTATNKVQVVVTDANGNPVAGVPVSFSAPSPAHVTVSDYTTDVNGVATAALASPAQGSVAVSAEANGSRRQVNVMFAALSLTVKATDIIGELEVGQMLEGQYSFSTNGNNTTDNSTFVWSGGGQRGVTTQTYKLIGSDVGKILTFSVTARNGAGVNGNTDSISTKDAPGTGGGSGERSGEIIDPAAIPVVKDLNITGVLLVGQTLTGRYTFNPNSGDSTDKSTLAWSGGGQSGVTTTAYTLESSDVGRILTFTVTPVNGKGTSGTPVSIDTRNATDTRGGDSDTKGAIIDPAVPSEKLSTLKSGTQSITADGKSEAVLTFEVKNAANEAITGLGNNVVFNVAGATVSLSGVSEAPPGTYTVKLTGRQVGTADVTVSVNGVEKGAQIALTAGTPDGAHSVLKANPVSIVANNGDTVAGRSTVTLTLKDTQDNLVTGLTDVALDMGGVTGTALTAVTESPAGSGVYTATLSGTMAGTATLTASAGGAELNGLQAQVTLTPDISMATVTAVTETAGGANADNTSTNTLTATVKDANGNPVPNATVDWNVTTGIATLNSATSVTDGNGQAVMTVKDTTAETATVSAKVGINTGDSGQSVDTAFSVYPVVSGITNGVNNSPADSITANKLLVQVSDLAGNALANQAVSLSLSGSNLGDGPATLKHNMTVLTAADSLTATTDGNGQLLLEATDVTHESITVSASVNNGSTVQTQTSTFSLYPVLGKLELGINNALADNVALNRYVATVTDKKGNVLPDTPVTVTFSLDSTTATADGIESPWTGPTDGNGMISIPVKNSVPETVTMTAHIQGNRIDVKTAEALWTRHYEVTGVWVNGAKFDRLPRAALVGARFTIEISNDPDAAKELNWAQHSNGIQLVAPGTYEITDATLAHQDFEIGATPSTTDQANVVGLTSRWENVIRRSAAAAFDTTSEVNTFASPASRCADVAPGNTAGRPMEFNELGAPDDLQTRSPRGSLASQWGDLRNIQGHQAIARYVSISPSTGSTTQRIAGVVPRYAQSITGPGGTYTVPSGAGATQRYTNGPARGNPGTYDPTTGMARAYSSYGPTDAVSYYCIE